MSWDSVKSSVKLFLKDYKEVPNNKTLEENAQTYKKNAYTLKYMGSSSTEKYANNTMAMQNLCELRIMFENNTVEERDDNADKFIKLQLSIAGLGAHVKFTDERTFEDFDDKHTIGTLNFEIGIEGSCS